MTVNSLISARKKLFDKFKSIETDREFTESVAEELQDNKELLIELKNNPFLLIELFFRIRDKLGKLVPFFLNDEQKRFVKMFLEEYKKQIG